MKVFKEITDDHGCAMKCSAADNFATYIITSAYGHDNINDYERKFNRLPSSRWYNRHFQFKQIK